MHQKKFISYTSGYSMINYKFFCFVLAPVLFFLTGCGGEKKESSTPEPVTQQPAGKPGNISCLVSLEGTPPKMTPVKMTADKKCNALHAEPVLFQSVVANSNGMLKNVFVYVKEGLSSKTYSPAKQPAVINQKGCMYEPHVIGIQVGQQLRIENSDQLLHNVHSLPKINKSFNFAQPKKGMTTETSFTEPEVMVKVKCDVHPWMGCYIGVLDHPFFGVTDENGTCNIQSLPPGKYVLAAWHEEFGTIEKEVTIIPNETISTVFTFAAK